MEDLGEFLRSERLKRGIPLSEIQRKTKISIRYLEAIERGERSRLPEDIYLKGFLYNYGEAIGLNGWDVVARYKLISRESEPRSPTRSQGRRAPLTILVILVLIGIILAVLYFFPSLGRDQGGGGPDETSPLVHDPVDALLMDVGELEESLPLLEEEVQEPVLPVEEIQELSLPMVEELEEPEIPVGEVQGPSLPFVDEIEEESDFQGVEPAEEVSLLDGPAFIIEGLVHQESWFEVFVDGERVAFHNLSSGQEFYWEAYKGVWMRLGNARGVELTVNGEPVDTADHGVLTLEYGEDARN
ncbi:MAG: helix-turn-helix domain-containing protein [Limnochordia bacterium]